MPKSHPADASATTPSERDDLLEPAADQVAEADEAEHEAELEPDEMDEEELDEEEVEGEGYGQSLSWPGRDQ